MRLTRLCDAMLVLIVLETFAVWRRFPAARRVGAVPNALAGLSLTMALRTALEGARPARTLFWIATSLPAHLADLGGRLRG